MNYLLDKKIKRNKLIKYFIFFVVLFFLIFFKNSVFNGLSYLTHFIFRPIVYVGNNTKEIVFNLGSYFYSKKSLVLENENLKLRLEENNATMVKYNTVVDENLKIKEILNRKLEKKDFILAAILSKPNQSPYDTLVVDIGSLNGVVEGKKVFALGNIPIGYIKEVYPKSAKIILYSSPGEETEVVIRNKPDSSVSEGGDVFMQIVGRGAGNFEMILPRDFVLQNGTEVVLPGITPYVIGIVETIISDPRDSFQKALLISPVNIFELKFVEIEK